MGRMRRNVGWLLVAALMLSGAGCENPLLSVLKDKVSQAAGDPDIQVSRAGLAILPGGSSYAGTCQVAPSVKVITLTIANIGVSPLKLTGNPVVVLGGGDLASFSIGSLPYATIFGGQNSTFTLEFSPDTVGDKTISVTIGSNDPDTPTYTFAITAKGVGAAGPDIQVQQGSANIDLSHAFPFGGVHAGGTTDVTFTIWNVGTPGSMLGLSLNAVSLTGTDAARFSVIAQPDPANLTIPEGGSNTFTVRFSPPAGAAAAYAALAHIANNDLDEGPDYSFTITGTGLLPDIDVKQGSANLPDGAGSYAFGSIPADGPNEQKVPDVTFTIWNTGQWPLQVSSLSLGGPDASEFVVSNTTSSPVAAAGSTSFKIRFDPSTVGGKSATVTVNSDAPGTKSAYTFTVTGTGSFAPKVYWTGSDAGVVMKANLNGSNPETVLAGLFLPNGLAIDQTNNLMYVGENGAYRITRASLDGSSRTTLGSVGPLYGVAIDATRIYWAVFGGPYQVGGCDLDGVSNARTVSAPGPAFGIAVDPATSLLYWSDWGNGRVYVTDTSLSAAGGLVAPLSGMQPSGMAVDPVHDLLFWGTQTPPMLFRMNLVDWSYQPVCGAPAAIGGVAVDPVDGWVYWGDYNSGLWRSNLDGTGQTRIAGGGGRIYGVALDLVP
jgi:hypothetical protein